jgi:N-methylhydantoinase A
LVNAISTNVITLGAGGGSIVSITPTGDIATGPDSAGAHPGPACYGQGGERPTLTDAALMIGILAADRFLGGRKPLHPQLALRAFEALPTKLSVSRRIRYAWDMAQHNVAEGIRDIAIGRGIDMRDMSLVAFGAAGPMLLPGLLDQLPLRRLIVPPHPGLFSALGLARSDRVYSDSRCRYMVLEPASADSLAALYADLERELLLQLGSDRAEAKITRSFDACLLGQSWLTPFVPVPEGPITAQTIRGMVSNFHRMYEQLNGNRFEEIPVRAAIYRIEATVPSHKVRYPKLTAAPCKAQGEQIMLQYLYGEPTPALRFERAALGSAVRIEGPAIITEDMSTTFVPSGRTATVGEIGELIIV